MKKITQNLSISQKKAISTYTKTLIDTVFTNKIHEKEQLLLFLIDYSKNNSCSEAILKQTLLKGCFAKTTWSKQIMLNKAQLSSKVEVSYPKEVSDVRFLTEINIADRFANSSSLIKKVVFNSENPKVATATTSYGNMYKDVSINYQIIEQNINISADIKSGNNAFEAFKGVLGALPVTNDYQPYNVINYESNTFSLYKLQETRVAYLKQYGANNNLGIKFDTYVAKIEEKMKLLLDPISVNYLIQDELLCCIALNVLQKQPSFFISHKASLMEFNEKYFKQLEPYINKSIFDNKENFNRFMSKTIRVYNDNIADISKNVNNNFWKGTGFENIADDIFK